MTANAKPAYLYARFSSANQKESSIDRQIHHGKKFIEQHGWNLVAELKDEARSAFKGRNREEGASLYEFEKDAREGKFTSGAVLVCENVDRLSRQGAKASAKLIWSLNEMGVDVATYHDGHIYKAGEDADLMDLFSVIFKGALGREESAKKSKRSQAHWDKTFQAIQDGKRTAHTGQRPAWIDIVDGKYVLNEHRAEIVRKMYQWYCDGLGSIQILYKLREMGEKPWSKEERYKDRPEFTLRYIHKVLKARQAIGEYVTIKGETLATDFYPAVVDLTTFNKAQAARDTRRHSGGDARARSNNLFSGIAKCGECGKSATITSRKTKNRGLKQYIRCNEARYRHVECTNTDSIRYDVLEKAVLDEALKWIAEAEEKSVNNEQFENEIAGLERQKTLKQQQSNNIVEAITEGNAPKALIARLSSLEAEIEAIEQQVKDVKANWSVEAHKPARSSITSAVDDLRNSINDPDPDTRFEARASVNAALTRLIKRIDIEPGSTFRIWMDDHSWWHFDGDGTLLEAEQRFPADVAKVMREIADETEMASYG